DRFARREYDMLHLKVDLDRCELRPFDFVAQSFAYRLGQADQQQPVLACIARKNVAEARRDDTADAEAGERPHRVLARRAATEIAVGDQYLRLAATGAVEDELCALAAVGAEAQLLE